MGKAANIATGVTLVGVLAATLTYDRILAPREPSPAAMFDYAGTTPIAHPVDLRTALDSAFRADSIRKDSLYADSIARTRDTLYKR